MQKFPLNANNLNFFPRYFFSDDKLTFEQKRLFAAAELS